MSREVGPARPAHRRCRHRGLGPPASGTAGSGGLRSHGPDLWWGHSSPSARSPSPNTLGVTSSRHLAAHDVSPGPLVGTEGGPYLPVPGRAPLAARGLHDGGPVLRLRPAERAAGAQGVRVREQPVHLLQDVLRVDHLLELSFPPPGTHTGLGCREAQPPPRVPRLSGDDGGRQSKTEPPLQPGGPTGLHMWTPQDRWEEPAEKGWGEQAAVFSTEWPP